MMYKPIFSITDSTYSGNTAERHCGVIHAFNSSFTISSSTFINNSAVQRDVVVSYTHLVPHLISPAVVLLTAKQVVVVSWTHLHDSSFNIISSTFTNNGAANGGVMYTSGSSFNITSSPFTNNIWWCHGNIWFLIQPHGQYFY